MALKKPKPKSRAARWADTCGEALTAMQAIEDLLGDLEEACSNLRGVQEEYEEWKGNLPESLQSSTVGEKLEAVCDLSIEDLADNIKNAVDEARGILDEAEGIDLPQGFGRD